MLAGNQYQYFISNQNVELILIIFWYLFMPFSKHNNVNKQYINKTSENSVDKILILNVLLSHFYPLPVLKEHYSCKESKNRIITTFLVVLLNPVYFQSFAWGSPIFTCRHIFKILDKHQKGYSKVNTFYNKFHNESFQKQNSTEEAKTKVKSEMMITRNSVFINLDRQLEHLCFHLLLLYYDFAISKPKCTLPNQFTTNILWPLNRKVSLSYELKLKKFILAWVRVSNLASSLFIFYELSCKCKLLYQCQFIDHADAFRWTLVAKNTSK